jgi:hypothetical protein
MAICWSLDHPRHKKIASTAAATAAMTLPAS